MDRSRGLSELRERYPRSLSFSPPSWNTQSAPSQPKKDMYKVQGQSPIDADPMAVHFSIRNILGRSLSGRG